MSTLTWVFFPCLWMPGSLFLHHLPLPFHLINQEARRGDTKCVREKGDKHNKGHDDSVCYKARKHRKRENSATKSKKKSKKKNGNMKVIYSLIFVVLHKIAVNVNGDNVAFDNECGLL